MPLPTSLQSYGDCLDFFERVVDDPKGGRVYMGPYAKAYDFRLRCNKARLLHREENRVAYAEGHKLHGTSEYDAFKLSLKQDTEGGWYVYAERRFVNEDDIELLSELENGHEG
jgi:hypothetical protein